MNFEKFERGFSSNRLKNNNLSHFLQRYSGIGRIESISEHHFSVFLFPVILSCFCGSCFGEMEMNLEKPKEVFSQDGLIYNILFHFSHIGHILGDTNV
jgi:hypothetical protein